MLRRRTVKPSMYLEVKRGPVYTGFIIPVDSIKEERML